VTQGTSQRPPCRFESVQRDDALTVILDVAHNPPAMLYLIRKLKSTYPRSKFRMIVGMSSDKDTNLCGQYIMEGVHNNAEAIHLVQAAHPRAARIEDMLASDSSGLLKAYSHYDLEDRSVTRQIQAGLDLAKQNDEVLVICGSVFLMAEAREALDFDEPRDSECIAEVAGAHLRHAQENFGSTSPAKN
jgi:dihydrofolate synthase / folylpolyglutamate synthase